MAEYTHLILSWSKTSILARITSTHMISLYFNSCHKSEPSRSKDQQMSAAIKVLHSSNEFSSAVPTGRANLLVCFVALILLVSRFIIVFLFGVNSPCSIFWQKPKSVASFRYIYNLNKSAVVSVNSSLINFPHRNISLCVIVSDSSVPFFQSMILFGNIVYLLLLVPKWRHATSTA